MNKILKIIILLKFDYQKKKKIIIVRTVTIINCNFIDCMLINCMNICLYYNNAINKFYNSESWSEIVLRMKSTF